MNAHDHYTIVAVNTDPCEITFRHGKTGYLTRLPCSVEQVTQAIGLLRKMVTVDIAINVYPVEYSRESNTAMDRQHPSGCSGGQQHSKDEP